MGALHPHVTLSHSSHALAPSLRCLSPIGSAAPVVVGAAAGAAGAAGARSGTAGEMMYSGCICCYSAFNFDKIFVLCRQSGTCICVESKGCLAAGEPTFPVGLIQQEGFICKLGLPCCTYGLKVPDTNDLISSDAVCLCARSVAQFPFGDKSACTAEFTRAPRDTQRATPVHLLRSTVPRRACFPPPAPRPAPPPWLPVSPRELSPPRSRQPSPPV
jgi:hypothetical protein